MIQPLPIGAMAPLAVDGSGPCCHDCGSADTLTKVNKTFDFQQARVAVGNHRSESMRLPKIDIGLALSGIARTSKSCDFEAHMTWLDENDWFGVKE